MGRSSLVYGTVSIANLVYSLFSLQQIVRSSESCKVAQLYFKLGRPVAYQSFCTQGVLRLRKRVTLMVVTVSAILVISWGADVILHMLEEHAAGSVKLSPLAIPIAHTMLMFNSSINPFAYALLNQRFRKKMRQMIGSRSFPCDRVNQRTTTLVTPLAAFRWHSKTNWVKGRGQFPRKMCINSNRLFLHYLWPRFQSEFWCYHFIWKEVLFTHELNSFSFERFVPALIKRRRAIRNGLLTPLLWSSCPYKCKKKLSSYENIQLPLGLPWNTNIILGSL